MIVHWELGGDCMIVHLELGGDCMIVHWEHGRLVIGQGRGRRRNCSHLRDVPYSACKEPSMVRIRLRFDSTPLHYARQCWFLFDPDSCRLVGDVAYLIARRFGLQDTAGIQVTQG